MWLWWTTPRAERPSWKWPLATSKPPSLLLWQISDLGPKHVALSTRRSNFSLRTSPMDASKSHLKHRTTTSRSFIRKLLSTRYCTMLAKLPTPLRPLFSILLMKESSTCGRQLSHRRSPEGTRMILREEGGGGWRISGTPGGIQLVEKHTGVRRTEWGKLKFRLPIHLPSCSFDFRHSLFPCTYISGYSLEPHGVARQGHVKLQ